MQQHEKSEKKTCINSTSCLANVNTITLTAHTFFSHWIFHSLTITAAAAVATNKIVINKYIPYVERPLDMGAHTINVMKRGKVKTYDERWLIPLDLMRIRIWQKYSSCEKCLQWRIYFKE